MLSAQFRFQTSLQMVASETDVELSRSEYLSLIHEQHIKRLGKLNIFTNQEPSHVRDQSLGFN